MKTRVLAAEALRPLVNDKQIMTLFAEVVEELPDTPQNVTSQNTLHGTLAQVSFKKKLCSENMHALTSRLHYCSFNKRLLAPAVTYFCDRGSTLTGGQTMYSIRVKMNVLNLQLFL